jgi:hypothetical protein
MQKRGKGVKKKTRKKAYISVAELQTQSCDISNCADRIFATWGRTPEDRMAGPIALNTPYSRRGFISYEMCCCHSDLEA